MEILSLRERSKVRVVYNIPLILTFSLGEKEL
jgi:hypothetical protein